MFTVLIRRIIILTLLFSIFALPVALRAESENATYITTARVNFRAGASLDADIFQILPYGYELNVVSFDPDGWSRVVVDGVWGYVNSEFIERRVSAVQAVANEPAEAAAPPPVIEEPRQTTWIDPGHTVPQLLIPPVRERAVTGQISRPAESQQAPPVQAEPPVQTEPAVNNETASASDTPYITTARINFREHGSFDAYIFEVLPAGRAINIIHFEPDGWSRAVVNGRTGYVSSEFILRRDMLAIGEDLSVLASRVENVNWLELRDDFPKFTPIEVIDLRTGLRYFVQSFSNGSHADVVPITQKDTDIMLQTFGGSWAWTQRPVWISVNGRTFAASINGMPHGNQTFMENNGMKGHICLHVLGSRPHNGNASFERDNQNTVAEAWNARLR